MAQGFIDGVKVLESKLMVNKVHGAFICDQVIWGGCLLVKASCKHF